MRKYKMAKREVLSDVLCDSCGKSCLDGHGNVESAHLTAEWGYGSSLDGIVWDYDFCEECATRALNFILGKSYD